MRGTRLFRAVLNGPAAALRGKLMTCLRDRMSKRLIKVAKELNVATSTIVEFLTGKGFEIENKPIAQVSSDMESAVRQEFAKAISDKEKAARSTLAPAPRPPPPPPPPPVRSAPPPPAPATPHRRTGTPARAAPPAGNREGRADPTTRRQAGRRSHKPGPRRGNAQTCAGHPGKADAHGARRTA